MKNRNVSVATTSNEQASSARRNAIIDIHVLQTLPPNCANRDDKGSPKTAVYGGVTRARISSQAVKAAVRKYFEEKYGEKWVGKRTKMIAKMVADEIRRIAPDMDAEKEAEKVYDYVGKPEKEKDKTAALVFISPAQAKAVASLIAEGSTDKKAFNKALNENPTVDMALFGRMVATNASLKYDAAVQVAHAISTHAVSNEYDYFSALDDFEECSSAAHLDTSEFNSSTMYRYANVNVGELHEYLGEMTAEAVAGFITAFIKAMPSGKNHSFANATLPYMVYITIRDDAPISFADVFEKPVINSNGGFADNSEVAFCRRVKEVYENYGNDPVKSFGFGRHITEIAEKASLPELAARVEDWINTEM